MNIQVKPFLQELQWIQRFVEGKTTIPILSTVLFEVKGKTLTLTATDLELGGITTVDGAGHGEWSVCAPVGKLIKYLQKVDEPEVTLAALENHWLTVKHGTSATRIAGMSKESFPELPQAPRAEVVLGRLPLAIQRTAFAISSEESRFTLNGAKLEVDEDEARLIATDGHRLSVSPVQVKGNAKIKVLIPKKALAEVGRLEGDCWFSVQYKPVDVDDPEKGEKPDFCFFNYGQRKVVARALEGSFPDWRRVLPDEMPNHAFIPVKSTLKVLDRVALYADERSRCVRFTINDGKLTMKAGACEVGDSEGSVAIRPGEITGALPFEAGYNAGYTMDFLRATDATMVAFCWQNDTLREDGTVWTKAGAQSAQLATADGWRYCLMPMRLE